MTAGFTDTYQWLPVAQLAQQSSPAIAVSTLLSYHYSFLLKFIVFTVNEHGNICIAGLNHWPGYATDDYTTSYMNWIIFDGNLNWKIFDDAGVRLNDVKYIQERKILVKSQMKRINNDKLLIWISDVPSVLKFTELVSRYKTSTKIYVFYFEFSYYSKNTYKKSFFTFQGCLHLFVWMNTIR